LYSIVENYILYVRIFRNLSGLVDAFQKGAANEQFGKFIADFGAVTMNINGGEAQLFLNKWQSVTTWLLQDAGATKVSPAELRITRP
jgi:hypothetical protein